MEQISGRLPSITHREVVIVFVCILGAYLLRVRQSYDLKPAWRLDMDTKHYENGIYAQDWEKVPSPIVADVESDGQNEVIVVTRLAKLQILRASVRDHKSLVLPYIYPVNEASLITNDALKKTRQPVAIATGYLDRYQSMVQVRNQVIVVVTVDWTVLCFDHQLNLLWETQLSNQLKGEQYYIKEISVTVSSHQLRPDDRGVVIIGGSLGDRAHHSKTLKHDHKEKQKVEDPLQEDFDDNVDDEGASSQADHVKHFSSFALSGQDGAVRWHHLPGDFEKKSKMEGAHDMFKAHHFKLALRKGLRHEGELAWNQYTKAILQTLPHRWQVNQQDTKLTLARFTRDKTNKEEEDVKPTVLPIIGLEDHHIPGYQYGGLRPHQASEHINNPNAVVIHMQQGIEVLDLSSGHPLTRLKLPNDRSTYADINQDNIIDQIKGHFTDDIDDEENCMAVVRSGVPPHKLLFNGSICQTNRLDMSFGSLFGRTTSVIENMKLTVTPLTVKSVAQKHGIVNHLLGFNHLQWARQGMDSIFLVSNGKVTSYGPSGNLNWQVDTQAKWADTVTVFKNRNYFAPELVERYNNAFMPTIQATSLQVYGKQDAAVLAGWESIVLISLVDGRWLAEHSLPCQPDAPVVIGDLNNDGYNDYIVQCPNGFVAFHVEQYSGYWSTALICVCLLVGVVGLTSLCNSAEFLYEDQDESR